MHMSWWSQEAQTQSREGLIEGRGKATGRQEKASPWSSGTCVGPTAPKLCWPACLPLLPECWPCRDDHQVWLCFDLGAGG